MDWLTLLGVYFVTWWIVLFAVLPWGIKVPEKTDPGHAESAPEHPRLRRKAAITSLVAALVTALIWAAAEFDVFSVEALVQ